MNIDLGNNGFGKHNASLLHEKDHISLVERFINETIETYASVNESITNKNVTLDIDESYFWKC